jgi:hypothetical protein
MAQEDGTPNPVTFDDLRRKLGEIAKQKANGYSDNGPDLHAPMPDVWAADVLLLLNIIQHSGVTPHAWHIDLIHYVHKGGEDSSLSNHRPLTLVDVLRKVFSAVSTSRMRCDWTRLRILGTFLCISICSRSAQKYRDEILFGRFSDFKATGRISVSMVNGQAGRADSKQRRRR